MTDEPGTTEAWWADWDERSGRRALLVEAAGCEDDAEKRRLLARADLLHDQAMYLVTAHPLFAWSAYQLARNEGLDVPAWVLSYLDAVGGELLRFARPGNIPKAVGTASAKALGLVRRGGRRGNPFRIFAGDDAKGFRLATAVLRGLKSRPGFTPDPVIDAVVADEEAAGRPTSRSTVARAWRRYRWVFEPMHPEARSPERS